MDKYTTELTISIATEKNYEREQSVTHSSSHEDGCVWTELTERFLDTLRGAGYVITPTDYREFLASRIEDLHEAETGESCVNL